MIGSSRESYANLRDSLDSRRGSADLGTLSREIFAATEVVSGDPRLRSALADAGQPSEVRKGIVSRIFAGHVSPETVSVLAQVAGARWTSGADLVTALDGLAAQAAFLDAQRVGALDELEGDLFAFQRTVVGSADLQMALTNPAVGSAQKAALIDSLLSGRASDQARAVLGHAMSHLRGRRADSVVEELIDLAAEQRHRSVAVVRVARPLAEDQESRLQAALSRQQGREVRLNVALDPSVIGGISVRIGSQVLDATVSTRLEQARRALAH